MPHFYRLNWAKEMSRFLAISNGFKFLGSNLEFGTYSKAAKLRDQYLDYLLENTANRWGFTSSFNAASSTFTPSVYVGAVQTGTGQTAASAAPIYGGATNGYGTIHVDTDDGEIWIYA